MQKQPPKQIKKNILIPLAIALATFLAVTLFLIIRMHRTLLDTTNQTNLQSVKTLFAKKLVTETFFISSQLDILETNQDLQTAFLASDRERLQKIAAPIFDRMRNNYHLSHFYFINPDRTCFLRAHRPDFHGDIITRLTLESSISKNITASGLELGPLGTLTLRVVRPWRINGHLAGYIEIGRDIKQILPELHDILGVHLIASINRSRLPIAKPIATSGHEIHDHLIIDQTIPNLSWEEKQRLLTQIDHHAVFQENLQGKKYFCSSVPISDLNNDTIGDIVILADTTLHNATFKRVILVIVASASALGLAIFFLFYLHIRSLEKRLHHTPREDPEPGD